LACAETLTGLIHAYAIVRNGQISGMKVKGLRKRFKDKAFAAKVNRDIIRECENLGLTLDEFFELSINAIAGIKEEIGLN
jgi:predicted hydrolase (HD superfamily)